MELNMSEKELDRVIVLRSVLDGSLTKVKAATTLGLSERQIRRLLVKLKSHGPQGLISPKRGKTPLSVRVFCQNFLILGGTVYWG